MSRKTGLPIRLMATAIVGVLLASFQGSAYAQNPSAIDCKDFIDQAEAQRFFEAKGGPAHDPYYLDADGDGIACEPGPAPTPVSQEHAEYCEGFQEYLGEAPGLGGRYRSECADWIEQKRGYQRCPADEGLSYVYFSSLSRSQVNKLTDMQKSEFDGLMSMTEGDCVAVDVAKTTAWRCEPFDFYIRDYQRAMPGGFISSYYHDQLQERYQVVCMGAPIKVGGRFSTTQKLIVGTVGAAGVVYLYVRHRQGRSESEIPKG